MFNIRLFLLGYKSHTGEKTNLKVWWLTNVPQDLLLSDAAKCMEYAQILVDREECEKFQIIYGEV